MRTLAALVFLLPLAACGRHDAPPAPDLPLGIAVQDHGFEVPRNPAPGYHRDGAQVTEVGEGPWNAAGIRAGDIVATVNGSQVFSTADFEAAVGSRRPSSVRVVGTRSGVYGSTLVDLTVAR